MKRLQVLVFTCLLAPAVAVAQPAVTLHHVHGLAYSADGKQLMIPSHHGLAIYRDGKWSKAPGPAHDYMGFAAARTRLYSSGHPAEGSGLVNPFGLCDTCGVADFSLCTWFTVVAADRLSFL